MVSVSVLQAQLNASSAKAQEYEVVMPLNLYDSPDLKALATQAIAHRHLRFQIDAMPDSLSQAKALPVVLCEDCYPGWIHIQDIQALHLATEPYHPQPIDAKTIQSRIPGAIAFAQSTMTVPNEYLWGGTLGPNLDCSGLVQRAFGSQEIWLPRDAYQQEAFTETLHFSNHEPEFLSQLKAGDLIFFGPPEKATHVAIYLGDGAYIHSSGKDQGRNQIGIDYLNDLTHPVSQAYFQQIRGAGRVTRSFIPLDS